MNHKLLLPACLLLLLINIAASAQKNITVANMLSLNGKWQFQTDSANIGEDQKWYETSGKAFSDELIVPGNWNTENRYASYTGKAWYKRTVFIPAALKGKLLRLYFEGVYNVAKVWVNGSFVTTNDLGYLQFEKDVSGLLRYGAENTIVVSADNQFKLGATWNWGGIRRPVKLLINDEVYIKQNHVTTQVDLSNRMAQVKIELSLSNASAKAAEVYGSIQISKKNKLLKTISFKTAINPNEALKTPVTTLLERGQFWLWDIDDPNLYDYKITLYKGKSIIDSFKGHFGLRVVELDNIKKQLKLNGKVIRPLGFNLVPDDRTTGNTLPLWRVKEDVDMMKSLGAGVARMSHVPYHQELLDYLDEKGILIFEEIPIWGYTDELVKVNNPVTNMWLQRMINDHYNHPCIAGWSVGNEIGYNKQVMGYVDSAIMGVKRLDTTRMGVMVSHSAERAIDPLQYSDFGFINGYGRGIGNKADQIHKMHPESTLFYSEFGLGQLHEELDTDFPIQALMDSISHKPFLVGASLWTFNDYRSWYKDTKEASQNRPWGLVDVARQKKKAFFSFRRANKPVALFQVEKVQIDPGTKDVTVNIAIKPRDVFDLPAYQLNNYRVVFKLEGKDNRLTGGSFIKLPVINPGDSAFTVTLKGKQTGNSLLKANISLVSTQDYVLYDTVVYFQKPLMPRVLFTGTGLKQSTNTSAKAIVFQVRFEKDKSATAYKLRYSVNGISKETQPTIDNYINITDSIPVTNAELIAINNAGESALPLSAIENKTGTLPPLIRFHEAANGGFYVGVETTKDDKQFVIQVTDKKGNYTNVKTTVAETKGVVKVDGLVNGKIHYYRVKRLTGNNEESGWSEETAIIPDGGLPPAAPHIQGLIRKGNEAVVCFQPVKKSTGYELMYKYGNEQNWHRVSITAAQIDQYKFKVAGSNGKIQLKLAAINQYGRSGYTILK